MSEKGGIDNPLLSEKKVDKLMGKGEKHVMKKKAEHIKNKYKKVCKEIVETVDSRDKTCDEWIKLLAKRYILDVDMKFVSREYLEGNVDIAKYMELYELGKKHEKLNKEIEEKMEEKENTEVELYEIMGLVYESEDEEEDDDEDVPVYREKRQFTDEKRSKKKLNKSARFKEVLKLPKKSKCKDDDCEE
jgi:hypothetical protein